MADPVAVAADIIATINQLVDLYAKLSANIQKAKEVLASNPDATLAQQIADAQAKLAEVRVQADAADAEFDAALAASQQD